MYCKFQMLQGGNNPPDPLPPVAPAPLRRTAHKADACIMCLHHTHMYIYIPGFHILRNSAQVGCRCSNHWENLSLVLRSKLLCRAVNTNCHHFNNAMNASTSKQSNQPEECLPHKLNSDQFIVSGAITQ